MKILDGLALCLSESLGSGNIQMYFREIRADAAGIPCQTGITYTTQIELDELKGAVEMANEEICPFCGGEIVNGAIVCRGCGANKGPSGDKDKIIRYSWFGFLMLLPAIFLAIYLVASMGVFGYFAALALPYVFFSLAFKEWQKRKVMVWHRRMA